MSFRFKQFIVNDEQCAMKVGTDGVLLAAWAASFPSQEICEVNAAVQVSPLMGGRKGGSILDIGTGSGLIALMLAQRFPDAHITAIDIDADAVAQANANFAASPWSTRLHAEQIALQDFYLPPFQLIISNPPFFCNSLKNPDKSRTLARHTDTLSYDELITHAARLLAPNGIFSLILPIEAEEEIITRAAHHGLYPLRLCRVRGNARKPFKRVMLDFRKAPETFEHSNLRTFEPHIDTLTLEDAPNHRSEEYAHLTRDFYL